MQWGDDNTSTEYVHEVESNAAEDGIVLYLELLPPHESQSGPETQSQPESGLQPQSEPQPGSESQPQADVKTDSPPFESGLEHAVATEKPLEDDNLAGYDDETAWEADNEDSSTED